MNNSRNLIKKWLDELTFSGDKKEIVANYVLPDDIKVTVKFNDIVQNWNMESKFFRLSATPGTEIIIEAEQNGKPAIRRIVTPGKQYVRLASNNVTATRTKMLNSILDAKDIQKELIPFVFFLRDGKFQSPKDEKNALAFVLSSSELSSLALGILLLGIYENGNYEDENITNCIIEFNYEFFDDTSDTSLLKLSLLDMACSLYPSNIFRQTDMEGRELRCKLQPLIDQRLNAILESSNKFSIEQLISIFNIHEYTDKQYTRDLAKQLINDSLKNLAKFSFDGVALSLDQHLPIKQTVSLHKGSAQSIVSCFIPAVPLVYTAWNIFMLFSGFKPDFDLVSDFFSLYQGPINRNLKNINKATAYLIGDIAYEQQGVFGIAALSKTCIIFSSYNDFYSESINKSKQYDNPKISLVDNILKINYNTDCLPNKNTMLYWPQDEFEKQYIEDNWAFGEVSQGRIAIHCSRQIFEHNDVLINKELEASGENVVWSIICEDKNKDINLTEFSRRIKEQWIP
jgi:hypothetical protein